MKPSLRTTYTGIGLLLGIGAPAGWLLLRVGLVGITSPAAVVAEVEASWLLYFYMLVSTSAVFGLFGFLLGVQGEGLRARNRVLLRAATRDPLTGLMNRRLLAEVLGHLVAGSLRYRRPIAFIMADIDNFKAVNDTFGHQAGDEVLRQVALALEEGKREPDITARYGGEEFLIALPETTLEEAVVLAERLRERVETLVVRWGEIPLRVTASFGIAGGIPEDSEWPIRAICEADCALYEAKETGRNRVVGRRLHLAQERGV